MKFLKEVVVIFRLPELAGAPEVPVDAVAV